MVVEQDPVKFTELVEELNKLLEEKEQRLSREREQNRAASKRGA